MKRKLQEKDFVGYDDYLKNKKLMNKRIYDGWEFVHEKSIWKIVVGFTLFGIGFVTLPLPTGSIPLMILGASLMSAGGIDIVLLRKTIYWKVITQLNIRRYK